MTSRADPRANTTFVYITLPGTTEMVVAGRLEILAQVDDEGSSHGDRFRQIELSVTDWTGELDQ